VELVHAGAKRGEHARKLVLADAVPSGQRAHLREPRLDRFEPLGIRLEPIAIVNQRECRLAELDLDARKRLARLTQRIVVLDEPLELLPGAGDERVRAAAFGLVQRLDRELEATRELVDVREPAALGVQARGLAVLERERLELGRLKAQQLELRVPLRVAALGLLELRARFLPRSVGGGDVADELAKPAVRVEQRALVRAL